MTTPKYPTEIEPAIWLQEDEEQGHGDCGCTLAQYNGARLNYCTLHAAAPELLEALKRLHIVMVEVPTNNWLRMDADAGERLDEALEVAYAALQHVKGETQMENYDPLWPDDFTDLDPVICDSPLCDQPAAYGANTEYDWRQMLCDPHYTKWCRDFNQRPPEEEDPPERLSFKVYFAEEVPLP